MPGPGTPQPALPIPASGVGRPAGEGVAVGAPRRAGLLLALAGASPPWEPATALEPPCPAGVSSLGQEMMAGGGSGAPSQPGPSASPLVPPESHQHLLAWNHQQTCPRVRSTAATGLQPPSLHPFEPPPASASPCTCSSPSQTLCPEGCCEGQDQKPLLKNPEKQHPAPSRHPGGG